MTDLWIDTSAVEGAGRSLQGMAEQLGNALPGDAHDRVAPAGAGQPGWAAWTSMVQTGSAWVTELELITGEVATAGQDLIDAARNYTGTDQHNADAFKSLR